MFARLSALHVNYAVASSNLAAVAFVWNVRSAWKWAVALPVLASVLYHLAEVKHGLPGVSPLNKHARALLWLDRLFAVASAAVVLLSCVSRPAQTLGDAWFLAAGSVGPACLLWSERDVAFTKWKLAPLEYLLTHAVWHAAAFYCLAASVRAWDQPAASRSP